MLLLSAGKVESLEVVHLKFTISQQYCTFAIHNTTISQFHNNKAQYQHINFIISINHNLPILRDWSIQRPQPHNWNRLYLATISHILYILYLWYIISCHYISHILYTLYLATISHISYISPLQAGKQKISDVLDSGSALERCVKTSLEFGEICQRPLQYISVYVFRGMFKTSSIFGEVWFHPPQVPNDVDWPRRPGDFSINF